MNKPLSEHQIDRKRDHLTDCALSILELHGAEQLTLRRLAETAGVSRQTPYLYFRDKSALLNAMRIVGLARLTQNTSNAVNQANADDFVEQLLVAGRAYVQFGLDNPSLYRLIFVPVSPDCRISDDLQSAIDDNNAVTQAPLQSAWDEGLLSLPPDRLNKVFWATLHGLISLHNEGLISHEDAKQQIMSDIETVLTNGFQIKHDTAVREPS